MRRTRFAFIALIAATVLTVGMRVSAQLPGCPVGIPQSFQNLSYCYFFGAVFSPSSTTGGIVDIATTIRPSAGGAQAIDGLLVNPTLSLANSSIATVTTLTGVHIGTFAGMPTSGVATAVNLLVDAEPASSNATNYGAWLKGTIAFSSAVPRLAFAPLGVPAIKAGTFGTAATIKANSPAAMVIDTGTNSPTSGVIQLPIASTGWVCNVNTSTQESSSKITAVAVDSVTVSNYGYGASAVLAWPNNAKLYVTCIGY